MRPEVIMEYKGYFGLTRLVQVPNTDGKGIDYVVEVERKDAMGNRFWSEQGRVSQFSSGEISLQNLVHRTIHEVIHNLSIQLLKAT